MDQAFETKGEYAVSTSLAADGGQCGTVDSSHPDRGYGWRCKFGAGHPGDCVNALGNIIKPNEYLQRAIDRLDEEGRLGCVVAGMTTDDGKLAPLCPAICSQPEQMCAGCAAKRLVSAG